LPQARVTQAGLAAVCVLATLSVLCGREQRQPAGCDCPEPKKPVGLIALADGGVAYTRCATQRQRGARGGREVADGCQEGWRFCKLPG
jgi:hypothetical protein